MSYLKTNIRLSSRDIAADAIGGGINNYLQGSSGGAPGIAGGRTGLFYGGFVMFTIADCNTAYSIQADSVLAQFYGVTMASNYLGGADGYKVFPILAYPISNASVAQFFVPNTSTTGSGCLLIPWQLSSSTSMSTIVLTLGVSISQRIQCIGFIISTPFGPWGA